MLKRDRLLEAPEERRSSGWLEGSSDFRHQPFYPGRRDGAHRLPVGVRTGDTNQPTVCLPCNCRGWLQIVLLHCLTLWKVHPVITRYSVCLFHFY